MENTSMFLALPRKHLLKHLLLVIVILALCIRIVILSSGILSLGNSLFLTNLDAEPRNDEVIFTSIAWNLVSGNGYSVNGEIPTARRPPGYPFLLAGVFTIFGKSWVVARVTNILISSLTVGVIYLMSCRLFNRNIGLIAALIGTFYPAFIRFSLRIISDTLFVFIISIALYCFTKIHDRPKSLGTKLICGVFLGVGMLTRSELLLFIPFLVIWAFLSYRQFYAALRTIAIILLPALLFVSPWVIRNHIVFDGFVMSTNLGRVMWGVHNPNTFTDLSLMGGWHPARLDIKNAGDVPRDSRDPGYRYLPEREWDQQHIKLALETIKRNIHLLPRMEMYKLHRLIFTPGAVRNLLRFPLVYCFFFGLILLLASGDERFLVFYMLMLYAVFSTLVFYTGERLRMSIDPTFIMIASYGLFEQIELVKHRSTLFKTPCME